MHYTFIVGSSLGHAVPALRYAFFLRKEKNIPTIIVHSIENIEKTYRAQCAFQYVRVPRKVGIFHACSVLDKILCDHPDSIFVTFGSRFSIPFCLYFIFRRKIFYIHEQNVVAGLANMLLGVFAYKILTGFPQTRGFFMHNQKKIVWVGHGTSNLSSLTEQKGHNVDFLSTAEKNRIFSILKEIQEERDYTLVCVLGGSQGSKEVTDVFLRSFENFSCSTIRKVHIVHQVRFEDMQRTRDIYQQKRVKHDVMSFIPCLDLFLRCSDVIVTRAGAGIFSEYIAYSHIPLIALPHRGVAREHQTANAQFMRFHGNVYILEKEEIINEELWENFLRKKKLSSKMIYMDGPMASINKISSELFHQVIISDSKNVQ